MRFISLKACIAIASKCKRINKQTIKQKLSYCRLLMKFIKNIAPLKTTHSTTYVYKSSK